MTSLRGRLLAWLLSLLFLVGIAAAGGAYVFMERRLTAAYDLDLADIARALVPHLSANGNSVRLELTPLADTVLRADSSDRIFYAVRDAAGNIVGGDPGIGLATAPPPQGDGPRFWYTTREAEPVRVAALDARVEGVSVTILAAETTNKRQRARRDALLSSIAPTVLLLGAAVVAMILGVRRGLGPIDKVREEVEARSHMDMSAIDVGHVADELRPLVRALNDMLARLEAAQSTQARFIANAAHQLRTPIAGLVTQLELAKSEDESRERHLAHAREAAARLARLASQILSLAAADPVSNPAVRNEAVDLADVVKSRADHWLRAATARGVELEFDVQPAPVNGVPLLLGELSENLVDNATRYGAKNVRIGTRREEDLAVLEVSDDGPGVATADRARIFERFQRIAAESTEGSGLGLAIVREIAQRHGAEIEVHDVPGSPGVCVRVAFRAAAVVCLFALLPAKPAHGARPMITDDARIVEAKACQVESWARRAHDSMEYWALPACNPWGNAELTFGGARSTVGDERGFTSHVIQAKTLFRPYESGGWGVGLAIGTTRHPHRDRAAGWPGDAYFYVPFSVALGSDDWVMHLNAGAVRRRDLSRSYTTWGLGNEVRLSPSLYLIPEVFASDRGRPFYQAGVRYWLVKDRVQVDATIGNRAGSGTQERWFSVGVRFLPVPFLP